MEEVEGFDHHDPEIEAMMVQRGVEQSRNLTGFAGNDYQGQSVPQMRRSMRAADPIAAILDEEEELLDGLSFGGDRLMAYVQAHNFTSQQVGVVISSNMAGAVAAFEKMQRDIQKSVAHHVAISDKMADQLFHYVKGVLDQVEPLTKKLGLVADKDVEVRRHGSAAFCPSHGPTRGGTCRKCQRGRHRA